MAARGDVRCLVGNLDLRRQQALGRRKKLVILSVISEVSRFMQSVMPRETGHPAKKHGFPPKAREGFVYAFSESCTIA